MFWADLDDNNDLVTRYIFGDRIDQFFARISAAGAPAWYLTDLVGSVTDIVDDTGSVINHVEYDSFGIITLETGTAYGDRIKYTSREWSEGQQRYYYRNRWYTPSTARFDGEDPAADDPKNLFRYVGNNPLMLTDPMGLEEWRPPKSHQPVETQDLLIELYRQQAKARFEEERKRMLEEAEANYQRYIAKKSAKAGVSDPATDLKPLTESEIRDFDEIMGKLPHESTDEWLAKFGFTRLPGTPDPFPAANRPIRADAWDYPYDENGKRILPEHVLGKGGFLPDGTYVDRFGTAPCIVCHGVGASGELLPGLTVGDSFVGGRWHHSGSADNAMRNFTAGTASGATLFPFKVVNFGYGQYKILVERDAHEELFPVSKWEENIELSVYPQLDRGSAHLQGGRVFGDMVAGEVYSLGLAKGSNLLSLPFRSGSSAGRAKIPLTLLDNGPFEYVPANGKIPLTLLDDEIRSTSTAVGFRFPADNGFFATPKTISLERGLRIDRYGDPTGAFAAPAGTPFGMRSLPPEAASRPLHVYEVLKPIEEVKSGLAAPFYGQTGLGVQYQFPKPIQWYIENEYLRVVPPGR